MDILLRIIAVLVEVVLLAVLLYHVLNGARLTLFDLGVGTKYQKAVLVALAGAGLLLLMFFIIHLTTFYPKV